MKKTIFILMLFCLVGCSQPVEDLDIGPVVDPLGCQESGGKIVGDSCECPGGTEYGFSSGLCI